MKQVRDGQFEKELHERLELAEKDKTSAIELAEEKTKSQLRSEFSKLQSEIARLQSRIDMSETEKKLALSEAVGRIEKERDQLANDLKTRDSQQQILQSTLKEKYESELKSKDEMIAYYKDMKAKLSTKMVGET